MVILLLVGFSCLIHLFISFIVMKRLNRIVKSTSAGTVALKEIWTEMNGAKGICINTIYVIINKNQQIFNQMS